jgi:hypothetical protein
MTDRGSGYMINVGDRVFVRNPVMDYGFVAKLVEIDMSSTSDTIEVLDTDENLGIKKGEFMQVERTDIYPANIQEIYSFKVMKEELNKGICEVTFTKKNGEERVMPCTLVFDSIPEEYHPKGTGKSSGVSQDTIAVWCINKEGWRSFRVDSVTNFERLTGPDKGKKTTVDFNLKGF